MAKCVLMTVTLSGVYFKESASATPLSAAIFLLSSATQLAFHGLKGSLNIIK